MSCDYGQGDLALMLGENCYTVKCVNERVCQTAPAQPSKFFSRVAYLKWGSTINETGMVLHTSYFLWYFKYESNFMIMKWYSTIYHEKPQFVSELPVGRAKLLLGTSTFRAYKRSEVNQLGKTSELCVNLGRRRTQSLKSEATARSSYWTSISVSFNLFQSLKFRIFTSIQTQPIEGEMAVKLIRMTI